MGKTEDKWYMENVVKPAIEPLITLADTISMLIDRVDALEARPCRPTVEDAIQPKKANAR